MDRPSLYKVLLELNIKVARADADWLICECPFAPFLHKNGRDYRPSFGASFFSDNRSGYYCHACKMHGRISSLARQLGHYRHKNQFYYNSIAEEADHFDRANIVFGDWDEILEQRDILQEPLVEEIFENMYSNPLENSVANAYLKDRGISNKTSESLDLRWDAEQQRILFPVRGPNGSLYGFSGRAVDSNIEPKVRH